MNIFDIQRISYTFAKVDLITCIYKYLIKNIIPILFILIFKLEFQYKKGFLVSWLVRRIT